MVNVYIEPRVENTFGQLIHGVMALSKGQFRRVEMLKRADVAIVSTKQSKEQAVAMGKRILWVSDTPRQSENHLSPVAKIERSVRFIQPQLDRFQLDLRDALNALVTLPA